MREYELTIVIQPELEEEARNELLERVQSWLAVEGSEEDTFTVDHWGSRQLAYPIQNHNRGYYVYYEVNLDPNQISEIERNILFAEDILRHLFVRKEI